MASLPPPLTAPVLKSASESSERGGEVISRIRSVLKSSNHLVEHEPVPPQVSSELALWASTHGHFHEVVCESYGFSPNELIHDLPPTAYAWVEKSLTQLVERFSCVFQIARVKVAFGAIQSDRCRKFHVDYVRCRLVATWLGPGTEWLEDGNVNRDALVDSPPSPEEANALIVESPEQIRRARAGDILWLRGAFGENGGGCVHRSPPIEHEGAQRVVAILTTVEKNSPLTASTIQGRRTR